MSPLFDSGRLVVQQDEAALPVTPPDDDEATDPFAYDVQDYGFPSGSETSHSRTSTNSSSTDNLSMTSDSDSGSGSAGTSDDSHVSSRPVDLHPPSEIIGTPFYDHTADGQPALFEYPFPSVPSNASTPALSATSSTSSSTSSLNTPATTQVPANTPFASQSVSQDKASLPPSTDSQLLHSHPHHYTSYLHHAMRPPIISFMKLDATALHARLARSATMSGSGPRSPPGIVHPQLKKQLTKEPPVPPSLKEKLRKRWSTDVVVVGLGVKNSEAANEVIDASRP